MGDAGLSSPLSASDSIGGVDEYASQVGDSVREVNVLVTGFDAFKSFAVNPSWMIASALPALLPASRSQNKHSLTSPMRPAPTGPYRIKVHTYPHALRVSYDVTASLTPHLVAGTVADHIPESVSKFLEYQYSDGMDGIKYDYVLHIGMAGGRDNYTLETVAHRDHYIIKDVDNRDGLAAGESTWRREGMPDILHVGWDKEDVLQRWEQLVNEAEDQHVWAEVAHSGLGVPDGSAERKEAVERLVMIGKGRRAQVDLSKDAGRFLCEFLLYTSLGVRWKEAQQETNDAGQARDRSGKIAFLHVPGCHAEHDIARGVRVATSAIQALVDSWEEGYRNADVYKAQ